MMYAVGDRVVVDARAHPGHHRTPSYVKGRSGWIEHVYDRFPNPETLAYGGDGLPEMRVYLVGFERSELWPDLVEDPRHRVYADIYEHWLAPAP